jgi:hypothetical protein
MDGLDEKVVPTGVDSTPAAEPAVPQIDPQRYAALEAFYNDTAPFVEKVRPMYDKVVRYVDDDNYRNLADQAYESFQAINAKQEPEVPAWAQTMSKNLETQTKYVEELRNRESIASTAASIKSIPGYEMLEADNFSLYRQLESEAKEDGITTLDGFAKYVRRILPRLHTASAPETPITKTPPRSLRGDTSLPGVPAPKTPAFSTGRKGIQERKEFMKSQLRNAAGGR